MSEPVFSITLTVEGLENAQRLLGQDWKRVVQTACVKVGKEVQLEFETAPGPAHQPVIWASERQRRWWHAARAEAGLPLEYARGSDPWSKDVEHSWTTVEAGSTDAEVRTFVDYAPYIHADAARGGLRQQPQHFATGWMLDTQAVANVKASGKIEVIVKAEIADALKG